MQVILAKDTDHEFMIEVPLNSEELQMAKAAFRKANFPERSPRAACYEFYLQYCPRDIAAKGVQYIKPYKGMCVNKFIRKYGEEEGRLRFEQWKANGAIARTIEGYIAKYGEEEGRKKWKEKNSRLSVGEEALRRNGKSHDEIQQIRQRHKERSASISLDVCIARYGEKEGPIRYRMYKRSHRTIFSVKYWMEHGFTEDQARKVISGMQRRDASWFINRYGTIEGLAKYEEFSRKRLTGLRTANCGVSSLERDILANTASLNPISQKSILCGDKAITVDIFYPEYGLIVEVFGDYWHCNPTHFNGEDIHPTYKTPASDKWSNDAKRLKSLRKVHDVMVVWESEFKLNPTKIYEAIKSRTSKN